ncbi:uncharacterized protein LOC100116763 [Nasonia vitripennis]|uniref:DNA/RNA non-specific endonuclease/pyrophosphatase/phosphodiesterase domain-containing protein n=1 Tax=Nasonia vitripennis TaxID=7425 RepID=A0A7M7LLF2_NASVI|nr:uncharacterized protein LOC100116763 [Nasonia vitripennis]
MQSKFLAIAALCLLSLYVTPAHSIYCWVNTNNDISDRQPLVLQTNSNEFLYPSKANSKDLKLNFCETLRVACPQDNLVVFSRNLNVSEATLRCYGLSFFDVVGTNYAAPFKRIGCTRMPVAEANSTGAICPNGTIAHIGFTLSSSVFVPTIDQICFNDTLGQTHWAHSKVMLAVRKKQKESVGVPTYQAGTFYPNITMSPSLFSRDSERARLMTLLNDSSLVDMYIPLTGDNYLVEGMLVPRSDMFYRAQQDSTYFYINTVPMWKSVRDNNWKLVEDIVRKTAGKQSANFDVWTGGYQVLSFDNGTGNATEITLTTNRDGSSTVPVPKFLFKYVVDQVRNRGVVFVTLNNPHIGTITSSEMICQARSECTNLYPQFNVATMGYTYCCAIDSSSGFYNIASSLGLPTFPSAQPLI